MSLEEHVEYDRSLARSIPPQTATEACIESPEACIDSPEECTGIASLPAPKTRKAPATIGAGAKNVGLRP